MKKKFYKTLVVNLFFIFLLAAIVFIVDPYQRYRKPFYGKTVSIEQTALNPGLLKNYDYNSLILGSSMAQNFLSKDANKNLNGKFLNISIGGAQAIDLKYLFETAKKSKEIKKVLISLDVWALESTRPSLVSVYKHLYSDNHRYDYKYLLNSQSYLDILKVIVKSEINPYDSTYDGYKGGYESKNAINSYKEALAQKKIKKQNSQDETNKYLYHTNEVLEKTWINLLKENKETEFIFYFPPYSILTYKIWGEESLKYMEVKKNMIKKLLTYSNVKIYDFQNLKEITHDLNNYKDYSHYHPKINLKILEDINKNRYRVTYENYNKNIDELNFQIQEYFN